jgi:hypothetical protein
MTPLGWIGFGIVLFLGISALVITVECCMRSSQISRREEYPDPMTQLGVKPGDIDEELRKWEEEEER